MHRSPASDLGICLIHDEPIGTEMLLIHLERDDPCDEQGHGRERPASRSLHPFFQLFPSPLPFQSLLQRQLLVVVVDTAILPIYVIFSLLLAVSSSPPRMIGGIFFRASSPPRPSDRILAVDSTACCISKARAGRDSRRRTSVLPGECPPSFCRSIPSSTPARCWVILLVLRASLFYY